MVFVIINVDPTEGTDPKDRKYMVINPRTISYATYIVDKDGKEKYISLAFTNGHKVDVEYDKAISDLLSYMDADCSDVIEHGNYLDETLISINNALVDISKKV
jgi:hypothetical protein